MYAIVGSRWKTFHQKFHNALFFDPTPVQTEGKTLAISQNLLFKYKRRKRGKKRASQRNNKVCSESVEGFKTLVSVCVGRVVSGIAQFQVFVSTVSIILIEKVLQVSLDSFGLFEGVALC